MGGSVYIVDLTGLLYASPRVLQGRAGNPRGSWRTGGYKATRLQGPGSL